MSKNKTLDRRGFLKTTAVGVMGAGLLSQGQELLGQEKQVTPPPPPPPAKIKAYRKYGNTGFKVSDLALGGVTEVPVIKAMLDAGVNYIDTAESYSRGKSEIAMGQAIKGRDRKKLWINTKLHIKEGETKESIIERFNKCLERLDTDYVDSLMTHGPDTVEMVKYEPFHQACEQLKKEKKLRFTGISSHGVRMGRKGTPMDEILMAGVEDGRYSVILLVYNFIQQEMGKKVMDACLKKGIGVSLMKTNPIGRYYSMKDRIETMKKDPEVDPARLKRMEAYFEETKKNVELGDWFIKKYNLTDPKEMRIAASRFALDHPGAATLLARTDTFEVMDQFLQVSGTKLSAPEKKKLAAYKEGPGKLYCRHACGICETSCPHSVPVNTIMRYNHYFEAQGNEKMAMEKYAALDTAKANLCETCSGHCQTDCPFGVPVHGLLAMAHQNLSLA